MSTSFSGVDLLCWDSLGLDMGALLFLDTRRMREYFKAVAARDGDWRDASPLGCAHRERDRRRDRNQHRNPNRRGLLHQFDRQPTGEDADAAPSGDTLTSERTSELVERDVAADVLAKRHDARILAVERRAVHRLRHLVDGLPAVRLVTFGYVRACGRGPRRSPCKMVKPLLRKLAQPAQFNERKAAG
jgi:hypothetical protein